MRRPMIIPIFLLILIGLSHTLLNRESAKQETPASTIYFNDSDPDLLFLGNDTWEVAFRKTNGGIVYITDKAVGGTLSTGSRHECLWGASDLQNLFYVGGCSFHRDWNNHFSYSWSSSDNTLTLSYVTDPLAVDEFAATVQVVASNADYFDMQLSVQEHYNDGRLFDFLLFPSDLYFSSRSPRVRPAASPGADRALGSWKTTRAR